MKWSTTNEGSAPTLAGWVDSAYLSTTGQVTSSSFLLGTVSIGGPLAPHQGLDSSVAATIPLGDSGTYQIIVVSDATDQLDEPDSTPNSASQAIAVTIAPYAVLSVSNVTAPTQTIGDPAYPTISWTVTNVGTGVGQTTTWTDAVIASPSDNVDDPNAITLGTFTHTGGLGVNQSYTQTRTFAMPPGFSGRYHLFVEADSDDMVFEDGQRSGNVGEDPNNFDVMPIPYADLVVTSIGVPQPAGSGQAIDVSWTIKNQGIGLTSVPSWDDDLALASDPAGKDIVADYGLFNHLGPIGPGESYTRDAQITLPNGISGTYYFVVTAAASNPPYEFIYGNGTDNITVSSPFTINATPAPDLDVTSVTAPTTAVEGSTIRVGWTVQNVGPGVASGDWEDQVVLAPIDQPAGTPNLVAGTFDIFSGLGAGNSYTMDEAVTLPVHISGLYNVEVVADADGSLYQGSIAQNTGVASPSMTVTVMPRPDLQVAAIDIPSQVDAGGSFAGHLHHHQPRRRPHDRELGRQGLPVPDAECRAGGSILIEDLPNQSAPVPGEEYQATTVPVTVPQLFSGQVYVIVVTDAGGQVDEWPNGQHSTEYQPIQVNPIPLPDLVLSNVVVPAQVIAGSTFDVSYTVTNLAPDRPWWMTWTDSVWLYGQQDPADPGRGRRPAYRVHPHRRPGRQGRLRPDGQRHDPPEDLQPGTYYITPWTDLFSTVLQAELAVERQPRRPQQPRERQLQGAGGRRPGAVCRTWIVTSVTAPAAAQGGDPNFTVNWTVENDGDGVASPTGWIDTVYLTNDPTDPLAQDAITMTLGSVEHDTVLNPGDSYNASLTVELSPSAVGQYIVVYTDAPQPGLLTPVDEVVESNEDNNLGSTDTDVTPVPADLVVTNVSIPTTNYSGEPMTFSYTVTNEGPNQVWAGTQYWTDFIWVCADPTLVRTDASFLGQTTHYQDGPSSRCQAIPSPTR